MLRQVTRKSGRVPQFCQNMLTHRVIIHTLKEIRLQLFVTRHQCILTQESSRAEAHEGTAWQVKLGKLPGLHKRWKEWEKKEAAPSAVALEKPVVVRRSGCQGASVISTQGNNKFTLANFDWASEVFALQHYCCFSFQRVSPPLFIAVCICAYMQFSFLPIRKFVSMK